VAGVTNTTGHVFIFNGSTLSSVVPAASSSYGCAMDGTNTHLLVTNVNGSVYQVDPNTTTLVGTVTTLVHMLRDIVIDQNGDTFVSADSGIWRIRGGSATTVTTLAGLTGGLIIDIDTGDLIVQEGRFVGSGATYRMSRSGGMVATLSPTSAPRHGIAQHIPTGDIYIGSCCGDLEPAANLYRLKAGSAAASVFLSTHASPVGCYSVKADRSSAAAQALLIGAFSPAHPARGTGGWYTLELTDKSITLLAPLDVSLYECEFLYRRNVYGLRTGNRTWNLGLAIPEDPGRPYVVPASLSGVRPGIDLPDGRTINLNPDGLTSLVLGSSTLAPILTNLSGTLDAQGRATVGLDLSSFGASLDGVLIHFVAVTLDVDAPLGIKTITDPFVLRVE